MYLHFVQMPYNKIVDTNIGLILQKALIIS